MSSKNDIHNYGRKPTSIHEMVNQLMMGLSMNYGYEGDIELTVPEAIFFRIEHELECERVFLPNSYVFPRYKLTCYTPWGRVVVGKHAVT